MAKPLILTVDDDANVLKVVDKDLRSRYGKDYQVVSINLGTSALEYLKQVQEKHEQVAMLVVDQRMPMMSGVEFLAEARQLFPAARRVLLTAYADTEAAISAINTVGLDYYLMKPWDPPEENLYPYLDDLLADWASAMYPPGARRFSGD